MGKTDVGVYPGTGAPGIQFAQTGVPFLIGPKYSGAYYGCYTDQLPQGPAIKVVYSIAGPPPPDGCAGIDLLPQCTAGDGVPRPNDNDVPCYPSVADIQWPL